MRLAMTVYRNIFLTAIMTVIDHPVCFSSPIILKLQIIVSLCSLAILQILSGYRKDFGYGKIQYNIQVDML
jgi:hypothetical protein